MIGVGDSLAWIPIAVLVSSAISAGLLWMFLRFGRGMATGDGIHSDTRILFLIRDGLIIDHSPKTDDLRALGSWPELRAWLGSRFSDIPKALVEDEDGFTQVFRPKTKADDAILTIHHTRQGQCVTLEDKNSVSALTRHALLLETKHAGAFQNVLEQAPAIVFELDRKGDLKWNNARFEQLPSEEQRTFVRAAWAHKDEKHFRISLDQTMSSQKLYYDLSVVPVSEEHLVVYANDVTRLVEADSVRNDFVQTLTKTFADLSTGLAVFDRDQRLVLFNPAILDLTDLPADFLTMRPHMMEFFDRLRDKQKMPEPKSYSTWRGRITEIIKSAENGHYSESWSLPGGLTYKLTGRPHPNGAIAFLIEDITDEMTLTRQSRSQLETHQAILDAMHEAIAVVGPDGGILVCNASFTEIVGFDPDTSIARTSFKDVVTAFKRRFPAATIWDNLSQGEPLHAMQSRLHNETGAQIEFRVEPLPDGLFMLNLSKLSPPVSLSA